jgi:hypothetical protein
MVTSNRPSDRKKATVKATRKQNLIATTLAGALAVTSAYAQTPATSESPTPGFNNKIPESILTPDTVPTSIGTLNFVDGVPTADSARRVYDNLDFLRGVEVFLNFIPAASLESMRVGAASLGATQSNQAIIFDQLMDSNPLFLTGNTDTVYCMTMLDLQVDGPTVVEIPPGSGPGTVNDAFFRFVVDMGAPGPDKGKGGKYLILPPGYKGAVPSGYFVAHSRSYVNWLILRGFLVDGKPDQASRMFREGLKVYPLAKAHDRPPMQFINGSRKPFNTIHANTFEFYKEVDHVIQKEPVDFIDPELRGLAASIGIKKGQAFAPDERMTKILTDAVAVGNGTARAISFRSREPRNALYPNSQWQNLFGAADYQFLENEGTAGRNLDARTLFYYGYTVNTPAMILKIVGKGSQYGVIFADKDGNPFDGGRNYQLHIPPDVPAKDFWSVVLYDTQTRSELQTSQPFPSRNNKRDKLIINTDGSVDLYFGPNAPAGREANWVATVPDKGWFAILRLYGALEPWFDKTWRPGEIEEVQ